MMFCRAFKKPPVVPTHRKVDFICAECGLPKVGVPGQVVCSSTRCRAAHQAKIQKLSAERRRKQHAAAVAR